MLSTRTSALVWAAVETGLFTVLALIVSITLDFTLVWLLLPLALLLREGSAGAADYGLEMRFRPPSFRFHVAFGALLLALYALGHTLLARSFFHQTFVFQVPSRPLVTLVREFLGVGVPEELFFRGYLQSRWNRVFGRPWRCLEARVGPGLLVQATVFALCHLATGDWRRLSVFFFALLAGWLRERSGSIFPGAAYHAVANVWFRTLLASFR